MTFEPKSDEAYLAAVPIRPSFSRYSSYGSFYDHQQDIQRTPENTYTGYNIFMTVLRSISRSCRQLNRQLQEKYIYDRVPLVCVIVFTLEFLAMSRLIATFNTYYDRQPLITMMISNAILNGIADTVAQTVTAVREQSVRRKDGPRSEEDAIALEIHEIDRKIPNAFHKGDLIPTSDQLPPPFDFERLTRFMAWGIIMAPIQFTWFKFLSKNFPIGKKSSMGPALKRMACDQLMFAPLGLVGFFTFMTIAEGGGKAGLKRKFENVYVPALRSNYMLWPAVQIINFRVMPIQFQLPFASTVGIFWTTYLSLTNSAADVADE